MNNFFPSRLGAALILALLSQAASAQYVWIDAKGHKNFSDRAPPPTVPLDKILRSPTPIVEKIEIVDPNAPKPAPVATAAVAPTAEKLPPTLAEQNAEFKKRQQERAEADAKARQEATRRAQLAEDCNSARQSLTQLQSGERIRVNTASGEPGYMSDAERATSIDRVKRTMSNCQ
jgi:hypothetical protein